MPSLDNLYNNIEAGTVIKVSADNSTLTVLIIDSRHPKHVYNCIVLDVFAKPKSSLYAEIALWYEFIGETHTISRSWDRW